MGNDHIQAGAGFIYRPKEGLNAYAQAKYENDSGLQASVQAVGTHRGIDSIQAGVSYDNQRGLPAGFDNINPTPSPRANNFQARPTVPGFIEPSPLVRRIPLPSSPLPLNSKQPQMTRLPPIETQAAAQANQTWQNPSPGRTAAIQAPALLSDSSNSTVNISYNSTPSTNPNNALNAAISQGSQAIGLGDLGSQSGVDNLRENLGVVNDVMSLINGIRNSQE